MNRIARVVVWAVCLVLLAAVSALPQPQGSEIRVQPLLTTQWGQRDPFNLFAPRLADDTHQRLGCWSSAIAQILYYHRLQPHGAQTYQGVAEYFSHTFAWDQIEQFVAATQGTPARTPSAEETLETAHFCYQVAVVVGKDFAAGSGYVGQHLPGHLSGWVKDELPLHFLCSVESKSVGPDENQEKRRCLEDLITRELNAGRPLMLYMEGCSSKHIGDVLGMPVYSFELCGHAMVIDGYGRVGGDDGQLWVHLMNLGYLSAGGWYHLWSDVNPIGCSWGHENETLCDSSNNRFVMAIRPLPVILPPIEVHVAPYVVGTGIDGAVWTIPGLMYPPSPGPDEYEYEYDPWPEPDPIPAAICVQGAAMSFDFALVDPRTNSRVYDGAASLSLVQVNEGTADAILVWDLFSFDPGERRYTFRVDTTHLSPGIYDLYIATSHVAKAYAVRIKVIAPQ